MGGESELFRATELSDPSSLYQAASRICTGPWSRLMQQLRYVLTASALLPIQVLRQGAIMLDQCAPSSHISFDVGKYTREHHGTARVAICKRTNSGLTQHMSQTNHDRNGPLASFIGWRVHHTAGGRVGSRAAGEYSIQYSHMRGNY